MSPHAKVCRGCAGDGIGTQMTPRQVQVIRAQMPIELRRKRSRLVTIKPITEQPTASYFHGPLAWVVEYVEDRLADDWKPTLVHERFVRELLAHWKEWRCSWCHGTGVPQLSVNTLRGGRRG